MVHRAKEHKALELSGCQCLREMACPETSTVECRNWEQVSVTCLVGEVMGEMSAAAMSVELDVVAGTFRYAGP